MNGAWAVSGFASPMKITTGPCASRRGIVEVEQGRVAVAVLEEERPPVAATQQVVDDDLVAMDGIRDRAARSGLIQRSGSAAKAA